MSIPVIEPPELSSTTSSIKSSYQQVAPRIEHGHFFKILILLVCLPVAVIAVIWQFLPPVEEGKLLAKATPVGLPEPDYYQTEYRHRKPFEGGELLIQNLSDQEWTHLHITINNAYQISDIVPIKPGQTARFELNRFVSRSGARFSLQYNELKNVLIYARRPTKDRATFYQEFDTVEKGTRQRP
jgi:hypothetical protein